MVVGFVAVVLFWVPPVIVAAVLGRRAVQSGSRLTGPAFASVLALVAWWFVLVGVGDGMADVVVSMIDGLYRTAAILGILLLGWFWAMARVWGRARLREEAFEVVTSVSAWALGLSVPLAFFILLASVI